MLMTSLRIIYLSFSDRLLCIFGSCLNLFLDPEPLISTGTSLAEVDDELSGLQVDFWDHVWCIFGS